MPLTVTSNGVSRHIRQHAGHRCEHLGLRRPGGRWDSIIARNSPYAVKIPSIIDAEGFMCRGQEQWMEKDAEGARRSLAKLNVPSLRVKKIEKVQGGVVWRASELIFGSFLYSLVECDS